MLDARLRAAAELVSEQAVLCDVGTDHAYLPCALAKEQKIQKAIAMDINEGPLENARRTVLDAHLENQVELKLSDGLKALTDPEKAEITDVVICGMGGELIDAIVSDAAWLKDGSKTLILQPMTQVPYLRTRLYEQGFAIEQEIPVTDKHHIYSVMRVKYTGESRQIDAVFAHAGKVPEAKTDAAVRYIQVVSGRLLKAAMGMEQADPKSARAAQLREIASGMTALLPPQQPLRVKEIAELLDQKAPFETACSWDNSGLQVGNLQKPVTGVVLALDCTDAVIDYAIAAKANLIVTHHPLLFVPIRSVEEKSLVGRLLQNGISLISAHTNLDLAKDGVNDCLAALLGISVTESFGESDIGRVGTLPHPLSPEEFAALVKQKLHTVVQYWEGNRTISKVALVGGAGSDELPAALGTGADAYLTGELKHNCFVDFANSGMTLLAAGHYATEEPVLPQLKEWITTAYPQLPVQIFALAQLKCL